MLNSLFEKMQNGNTIVYDGDMVGWMECSILEKHSFGNYTRAKVETLDGTKLFRIYKEVSSADEILQDGCVYSYKTIS